MSPDQDAGQDLNQHVAKKLSQFIRDSKLTLEEITRDTGYDSETIDEHKSGSVILTAATLYTYGESLGKSITDFYRDRPTGPEMGLRSNPLKRGDTNA